jgi:hypothetical protein
MYNREKHEKQQQQQQQQQTLTQFSSLCGGARR